MRLSQFGRKEGFDDKFKFEVKDLRGVSVRKNDDGFYYWIIDENIFDLKQFRDEFILKYPREVKEFEKRYNEKLSQEISFNELSHFITENGYKSQQLFTIEADVYKCVKSQFSYYLGLIFDDDKYKQIEAIAKFDFMPDECISDIDDGEVIHDLINKRIKLTGTVSFNEKTLKFQFNIKRNIEIIGESILLSNLHSWENICKSRNWLKLNNSNPPGPLIQFEKIGLIYNESTKGYEDFDHFINLKSHLIIKKDIILTANNIIQAINELNEEGKCQMICIIRGGGSLYDLYEFSDLHLVEAVVNSKIPIVIVIGHHGDKILCADVAAYNAGSPTGVAKYINFLMGNKKKKIREETQREEKSSMNNEIEHLKNRIRELESKIADLEIQLRQKNSRGLLGRILNT